MGSSQEQRLATHNNIVNRAAARFREVGPQGLSIADLMKEAGLTHGGFYKHFESREDLVVEAVTAALEQGMEKVAAADDNAFAATVMKYLSTGHRDNPGNGCAMSAFLGDIPRTDERTRSVYTSFVRKYFSIITRMIGGARGRKSEADAMVVFSTMVGALGLARAVSDEKLSSDILNVVRQHLVDTYTRKSET